MYRISSVHVVKSLGFSFNEFQRMTSSGTLGSSSSSPSSAVFSSGSVTVLLRGFTAEGKNRVPFAACSSLITFRRQLVAPFRPGAVEQTVVAPHLLGPPFFSSDASAGDAAAPRRGSTCGPAAGTITFRELLLKPRTNRHGCLPRSKYCASWLRSNRLNLIELRLA